MRTMETACGESGQVMEVPNQGSAEPGSNRSWWTWAGSQGRGLHSRCAVDRYHRAMDLIHHP